MPVCSPFLDDRARKLSDQRGGGSEAEEKKSVEETGLPLAQHPRFVRTTGQAVY